MSSILKLNFSSNDSDVSPSVPDFTTPRNRGGSARLNGVQQQDTSGDFGSEFGENTSFLNHVGYVMNKLPPATVERMQGKIFAILYEELGKHTPKRKGV